MSATGPHLGKYRGIVSLNIDPEGRGRIQAIVPDVGGGTPTTWALPCLPLAATQVGMFAPPPIGAAVWIEYEHGDLDYPIWTGCFWPENNKPPPALFPVNPAAHALSIVLPNRTCLQLSDDPADPGIHLATGGGARIKVTDTAITIETAGGARLVVSDQAITLETGKGAVVELAARSITLNQGALKVD